MAKPTLRDRLATLLAGVLEARRELQERHDRHTAVQVVEEEPGSPHEELHQTYGALLRQLEDAARSLRTAIATVGQRDRVEKRLAEWKKAP